MGSMSRTVMFAIGLLGILGLGAAFYYGLAFFLGLFDVMDRQTSAIMAVIVITSLLCVSIVANGIKNGASNQSLHSAKLELYSELLREYKAGYHANNVDLENRLMLIAGTSVLKRLRDLKNGSDDNYTARFESLIHEMRKDLGQSTTGLKSH